MRGREHRFGGAGHAGQHQQAVRVHPLRGLDVGVEPVPDHQRVPCSGPHHRLFVQGRFGLARDQRRLPGRKGDHLQQRAVAGLRPVRAGQRLVGIGPDKQRAGRDGQAALGQQRVADPGGEALDDGRGPFGRGGHRPEPAFPHRDPQSHAADDEDGRARREPFRQQPRGGLRGGDDVRGRGGDPEPGQDLRDGGRGAVRVVGDVSEPHACLAGFAQGLPRAGDRATADVHDSVQVEEGDVVGLAERLLAGPGRARARILAHGPAHASFLRSAS